MGAPSFARVLAGLAVAALALGLGLTFGLRGLASDEPGVATRLGLLDQRAGPLVVFSEFGETADTLWAANPDDPQDRVQLGRVEHALGYGISPALSPDGARIAYTVLPPAAARPSVATPAELWLLDIDDGSSRRLAEDLDLLGAPVWSPASDAILVRRVLWGADGSVSSELLRIDLSGEATRVASAEAALFAIDFSPDGAWLYYAVATPEGTELARGSALGGGEAETVAHLSDGVARDWHLSPDGSQLAYLAQAPDDAEVAFVVRVLDLQTGEVAAPLADDGSARFNPLWERTGVLTVGRIDGGGGPARLNVDGARTALQATLPSPPPAGFDVPLSWSPDGTHLAVRSFERASVADPGPSRVAVVSTNAARHELSQSSDVTIVGWLEAMP